jgi:hypothetical protein
MAARVKKRTDTSTNRESDKIIVRLPAGMRDHLAELAARRGKSMNAEVVTALAFHFAMDGEPDKHSIHAALQEMKQEIKYLRDTLGLKEYEPRAAERKSKRKPDEDPQA